MWNHRMHIRSKTTPEVKKIVLVIKMMLSACKLMLLHLLAWLGETVNGVEIINGRKVSPNSMRYMVSVQNAKGHACGGFLIREDYVVTAAHCDKSNPTSVVLGTHNLQEIDEAKMRYKVTKCRHPEYKTVKEGNDIMLLKLTKKVHQDIKMERLKLPNSNMKLKDKEKCVVSGWGLTKTKGKPVDLLEEAKVSFLDLKKCKDEWNSVNIKLPKNIMCAGGYEEKEGFCQGDSGGPLVYKKMAVGVVSFNYNNNCDYPNAPNIYTDVSKHLPWINQVLKSKQNNSSLCAKNF